MSVLEDSESDIWDESDVQGFSFDDIETKHNQVYYDALAKNIGENVETTFIPSLTSEDCSFCNRRLTDFIKYEDKSAFCSEECWISCLRSSLSDLRSGGISSWPIDMFVSLDSKRMLIKFAAETLDGDFLLKVILSIKSRLNKELFFSILLDNELGYKHYLHFLTETFKTDEAIELMKAHGSIEDSKIFTFKARMEALHTGSADEAEKAMLQLHTFAATELSSIPVLASMHESVTQQADLLNFQLKIRSEWIEFLNSPIQGPVRSILNELEGPIVGQNLANTVIVCILMDRKASKGSRADMVKTAHNMSDEHYRWLVLEPLIHMGLWMEIDLLLLEKIKRRFIEYMPDSDSLINLVVRLGLFDLGIEHFIRRKDLNGLRDLMSRTPSSRPEFRVGQTYLSKPTSQWTEYISQD
ncbi:unnamed protein product [Hymenolepis diminuta]|uniref:Vps16_C domain-containing protein n=2 Tax=Hymenolepis diminuta TaxID=6216 RepID=A0A0R3S8L4_HYMDI|nr:unnamed protein product [Hymenolepis diminuta]